MKLKRILISQPKPESDKSPWLDVPNKHKVKLDFIPFIHVEGIPGGEFRKQKIDISLFTCIILNSRNGVDHYFRMANELRYSVPEKTKYFCTTEAIALYLQKYIQYRKRKIFFAQQNIDELAEPIRKNKDEKFLFVCSDKATDKTSAYLDLNKINYTQAILYRTVCSDMRSVDVPAGYEMIIFFSPTGIQSLFENYPDFKQGDIRIGVFGTTTYAAATAKGLRVDLAAPLPNAPSMTMALDIYIKEYNAKNGEVNPMVNFPVHITTNGTTVKPADKVEEKTAITKKPKKKVIVKKATTVKKKIATKPLKKRVKNKKVIALKKKTTIKKAAPKKKVLVKRVKKSAPKAKTKHAKKPILKKKAVVKKTVKAKKAKPTPKKGKAKKKR